MEGCNICLALKAVRHKPYNDFQLLPEPTRVAYIYGLEKQQLWLNLCYRRPTEKNDHYKPVETTTNAPGLAELILDVVVWLHSLPPRLSTTFYQSLP